MRTNLYDRHIALGAKIIDFGGWEMPVQYQGIIPEHHCVRQNVGLFDVSHMGRIAITGPESEKFLDYLSTNSIIGKSDFSATYTVLPNAEGGSVDDAIIYKESKNHFFVIVNAGNRQKDLEHFLKYSKQFNVKITSFYDSEGILAIQGPKAIQLVSQTFPEAEKLNFMHFCNVELNGVKGILSRTGYTGADGLELYAPKELIAHLWDKWLDEGKEFGIQPIGLGARDTLRLEMGFALFGHELSDSISALESVSKWTVRLKERNFLGREAFLKLKASPNKRNEYGVVLLEPGIARADYPVFYQGKNIGVVTSGTHSPTLNQAIAIILVNVELTFGEVVEIQIRQRMTKAQVTALPFIKSEKKD